MPNCFHFLAGTISLTSYYFLHMLSLLAFGYFSFRIFTKTFEYTMAGLILGGGTWNLIERIRFGCVSDYFNFFNLFHFNLADVAIVGGILTLLLRTGIKTLMPK